MMPCMTAISRTYAAVVTRVMEISAVLDQISDRCLASRPDQQVGGFARTPLKNGLRLGKTSADLLFGKRLCALR